MQGVQNKEKNEKRVQSSSMSRMLYTLILGHTVNNSFSNMVIQAVNTLVDITG